jgi:MFS family permease
MVLPDLPILLDEIGGTQHKWLIIPSFAIIALFSRPLSGKFSDSVGRVFVMCVGALITTLACFFYLFIPFVLLFFANRAFHGICAGFTPTGFTAYADDVVPFEKRGEAMGLVGICNNIGNAIGWVIGSKCTSEFGLNSTFIVSAILGLISFLIFFSLEESIKQPKKISWSNFVVRKNELFEKRVIIPSLVLLLSAFSSGAVLALIADYSNFIGIKNKGTYMGIYIVSSVIVRFMAGRWSDRYGRRIISVIGSVFLCISMLCLAFSFKIETYIVSSVFFGLGFGLISPSLFAWSADLALPGLKGKAFGTLFIFLELGIILGSGFAGIIYNNNSANFYQAFLFSGILAALPLLLILPIFSKHSYSR